MKAKLQSATEHYEAIVRDEHDRETNRLASQIVDGLDPEASIEVLEKLGEDRLRQIVEWLRSIKNP